MQRLAVPIPDPYFRNPGQQRVHILIELAQSLDTLQLWNILGADRLDRIFEKCAVLIHFNNLFELYRVRLLGIIEFTFRRQILQERRRLRCPSL